HGARARWRHLGDRELPREPAREDARRPASPGEGRRARRHPERQYRELRRGNRIALQRPAPRQRVRQLREGRPAHSRANQARCHAGRTRSPTPRHVRRADGEAAMTAAPRPEYFDAGWTDGKNPWAIALVVSMATFMEVLDTSIANVSLPHIA